jgi:hypothetical protein
MPSGWIDCSCWPFRVVALGSRGDKCDGEQFCLMFLCSFHNALYTSGAVDIVVVYRRVLLLILQYFHRDQPARKKSRGLPGLHLAKGTVLLTLNSACIIAR